MSVAPTPTALRILRGNPGKRPINQTEPQPAIIRPEMTAEVKANPRATEEWDRIAPMLERMRVLTEADYLALGTLCLDVAMLDEVHEKIRNSGLLIKTGIADAPMIRKNPLLEIRMQLEGGIHRWLCEFGMTPSSRTRLHTHAPSTDKDVWDTF